MKYKSGSKEMYKVCNIDEYKLWIIYTIIIIIQGLILLRSEIIFWKLSKCPASPSDTALKIDSEL